MNLMGGTFERTNGQLCFVPQGGVPVPVPPEALPGAEMASPGQKCLLGIRPEHISLPGSGPVSEDGESYGEIPAEVVLVEVTGLDTHIVASAPSGEMTVLIRGRFDTVAGDRLLFRLNFPLAHVFDAESGERMN